MENSALWLNWLFQSRLPIEPAFSHRSISFVVKIQLFDKYDYNDPVWIWIDFFPAEEKLSLELFNDDTKETLSPESFGLNPIPCSYSAFVRRLEHLEALAQKQKGWFSSDEEQIDELG
jgi:hypothetical protein